jgi:RHS repeat-associated protein
MKRTLRSLALMFVLALLGTAAFAQVQTGTPPFGSFTGGPDIVNLGNLNVHLDIPVRSRAGRGTNFSYDLSYDTSIWYPSSVSGTNTWTPVYNWGWRAVTEAGTGYLSYSQTTVPWCNPGGTYLGHQTTYSNWVYHDPWGVPHWFANVITYYYQGPVGPCPNAQTYTSAQGTRDGYTLSVTGPTVNSLVGASGQKITVPVNIGTGAAGLTDRNGNQIGVNGSGQFFDTLSSTAAVLTVTGSGTSSSPMKYAYTAPLVSATPSYVVNYTNYTVATNFMVSGVHEYKSPAAVPLVSSVVLPDGSQYSFSYEATPSTLPLGACTPYAGTTCVTGRVTRVTLPTGGLITYAYTGGAGTNGSGIWNDGSAATLTRVTPDGTWTYARDINTSRDTVTDPVGNQTSISIVGGMYETTRTIYNGTVASNNVMQIINTSYNGGTFSLPITQKNVTTEFSLNSIKAGQVFLYNSYGLQTEEDDYDYPTAATLLRKIITTYASLGNGIVNMPASVTVCSGSGSSPSCNGTGTVVQQTTYTYDQGTASASTGTPQHVGVTGSRGNATTIASGSTPLNQTFTYWDTGMVKTSTDVNGGVTTPSYSGTSCGNAFPTSLTEAISSLTKSFAWNCTGGVQTSVTDENGKVTTAAYANDPFYWRPDSITDPTSATVNFCYGLLSGGTCTRNVSQIETYMNFNGSGSTVDVLSTVDSLGRQILQQTRQGPSSSNFDTIETDYDSLGRVQKVSLPFSTTAGATNSAAPGTTTVYDALSRVTSATDSGNGIASAAYTQNDAYITVSPNPTGENTKRRQLEYNSVGQLTSVCEVTSLPGSGACAQNTPATGYWTKYSYNALGQITAVTQNAQSSTQTRTYNYDLLGRMTLETNPESGSTTYTYDTDSTCGTFKGDLVKRVDAVGNVICYSYDALHRPLSRTYPSGSYASVTPKKYFVYDSATVNGVAMTNVSGRLAEAYTCTGSCTSKITDLGFSYTFRGEMSDQYQVSPSSSGYYHAVWQYWPNGGLKQLSGLPTLPTFNYGVDPEGRISTLSATSGQNPLTATTYNPAGLPTAINFGSGDSDAFTYDPNTYRMTKYQFNLNGSSYVGTLGWNANGTLGSLGITDPFNSSDTQNCSYAHDDLVRISSANCGTAAAQTFSYDAFGNISKSGSPLSFLPNYSNSTNRMTSIASFTPTYDANGNSLNDGAHVYTWDSDGNHASVDGIGITYDAFGRSVEIAYPSEILYLPGGSQVLFKGQVARQGIFDLPGGAQAIYDSANGGLIDYYHPDHLGSIRLASTPARAVAWSTAYAPFGETYAQSTVVAGVFTGQGEFFGLDEYDFPAREYSDRSRWVSPDPAGLAAVNTANPQSWNRYAYVMNNPLGLIDPLGLDCVYANENGSATVVRGDCYSDTDSGVFVDGTIDTQSKFILGSDGNLQFGYTNASGAYGTYSIGGFFDMPGSASFMIGGIGYPLFSGPGNRSSLTVTYTTAYTGSLIVPIPGAWGLGPAVTVAYVPSQKLACLGGGIGESIGHSVSGGPVAVDSAHTKDILGGASFSFGYNSTPYRGAQGSVNGSGGTGGYSYGTPGGSASVTWSGCKSF